MGNVCYSIDNKKKKSKCKKCGDKFYIHYGGKSQRTSCRNHCYILYDGLLYCTICNKFNSEIKSRNCYHSVYKD